MGPDDYIDTVVLEEESRALRAAPDPLTGTKHSAPFVNDVRLTRVGGAKITSLTIDESTDVGGDPYNSTGKHCIPRSKQD